MKYVWIVSDDQGIVAVYSQLKKAMKDHPADKTQKVVHEKGSVCYYDWHEFDEYGIEEEESSKGWEIIPTITIQRIMVRR